MGTRIQTKDHSSVAMRLGGSLGAIKPLRLAAGNRELNHISPGDIFGVELIETSVESFTGFTGMAQGALSKGVVQSQKVKPKDGSHGRDQGIWREG